MSSHGDGWLDKPENVSKLLRVFYVLCGVVLLAEFAIHKHGEHELESWPFFHGIYGFVGIVILVFISVGLRKVVLRPESYYGDEVEAAEPAEPDDGAKEQGGAHD